MNHYTAYSYTAVKIWWIVNGKVVERWAVYGFLNFRKNWVNLLHRKSKQTLSRGYFVTVLISNKAIKRCFLTKIINNQFKSF